jgi:hypothetical protein
MFLVYVVCFATFTLQKKPKEIEKRKMILKNLCRVNRSTHMMPLKRGFAAASASASSCNWLANVPMGPPDPILGLTERFNKVRWRR